MYWIQATDANGQVLFSSERDVHIYKDKNGNIVVEGHLDEIQCVDVKIVDIPTVNAKLREMISE